MRRNAAGRTRRTRPSPARAATTVLGSGPAAAQVTHDEPGWRLTLTAPEAEPPVAQLGCLVVLPVFILGVSGLDFLPLLWGLVVHGERPATGALLGLAWVCLFLLIVFGSLALRALRATRGLRLLDVDRGAGTLRFAERAAFGWYAREAALALGDLEEATVALAAGARRGARGETRVRLALRARPPGTRPGTREGLGEHALSFAVDGLDRREEVADFALRLGAAAGFGAFRVVRNDARDTEVLLGFGYEGGLEPLRAPETKADYVGDNVTAPARRAVAEERVPPFDPATFDARPPLREWAPGRRVLFHKRWSWLATLACLPFALLPLGPLALMLGAGEAVGSRLAGGAVLLALTLPLAILAGVGLWLALPRAVEIDWTRGTLARRTAWSRVEIPLTALEAIELRGESRRHKPKNGAAYFTYRCRVAAWHRNATGGSDPLELAATRDYREDPDTPWRATLPLVAELAQVLGVKRRVIDFDA